MSTLIPCRVDTTPMANEIKTVSRTVKGTTAAVVTMQSAVIAAEKAGANKICHNVNRGFFTLMQSQISQKIAQKKSRVDALLMKLAQNKRQLLGIRTTMEREYGRIAARYLKIFTSINKELAQRIQQIDQPVFDLVNKHMATSTNRMNAMSAWTVTSQIEGLTKSQQILISKMKQNANIALGQSADFLTQIGEQRVLTNRILISNPAGNDDKLCQIPVVICETISNDVGLKRTEITLPDALNSSINGQIMGAIRNQELPWKDEAPSALISDEFANLLATSQSSSRVKSMIQDLYAKTSFQTL
ncbi:MAG: hypothetical protein J6V62_03190 [Paludibacteraceae bacterium]|nr:hypothetical protein [Paludibacteraceae bacterium]